MWVSGNPTGCSFTAMSGTASIASVTSSSSIVTPDLILLNESSSKPPPRYYYLDTYYYLPEKTRVLLPRRLLLPKGFFQEKIHGRIFPTQDRCDSDNESVIATESSAASLCYDDGAIDGEEHDDDVGVVLQQIELEADTAKLDRIVQLEINSVKQGWNQRLCPRRWTCCGCRKLFDPFTFYPLQSLFWGTF